MAAMSAHSCPARFPRERIDPGLFEGGLRIVTRLAEKGFNALFAGGSVRDALLNRAVADIDIATDATPERVQAIFPHTVPVGVNFGVVIVIENGTPYEVASFRSDLSYSDGRRPDTIVFSTPEDDAQRRDFTINGIFYDPLADRLLDFVGGQADLERQILRTIGSPEKRFAEDRLRLMRAVRFSAALGFEIEPETWASIRRGAPSIQSISVERVRDELLKGLTHPGAGRFLQLLEESGLARILLWEICALVGLPQPERFHPEGDVFTHVMRMYEHASYPLTETLAMGILLHDIGKPPTLRLGERIRFDRHAEVGETMARAILGRMKFSRERSRLILELIRLHLNFINVPRMRQSNLKKFLRTENFPEHLELHRLDCLASHGKLDTYDFCRRLLTEMNEEILSPAPLVTGDDLIALGLEPGPDFKRILADVEEQQLENRLSDKADAIAYIQGKYVG